MGSSLSTEAIEKVVARLRWRLRAQAALRAGLLLGALGLFVFAGLVALVKARVLASDWVYAGGALAIALPLAGFGLAIWRRRGDIELASALDSAGGLHSRLGSALAFARLPERTPMQEAAMADALTVVAQARPAGAAPWQWGAFVAGSIALAVALGVAAPTVFAFAPEVAPMPGERLSRIIAPSPFKREKAAVRKGDEQQLAALAEDLEAEKERAADPLVKEFLEDLNELIRALQEGRLTPEEAHARLAALEKALEEWQEKHGRGDEEAERKLQEAAEKLKKSHEALRPALDALREQALKEAAAALEKLAEKLAKNELKKQDLQKLSQNMEELSKALESQRQKEKERLQKERDRLKEKEQREKDRFAQKDKDRLKDNERQLEQLDQPDAQMSEAERQLEQLADELDDAAQDLLRRMQEDAQQAGDQGGQQGPAQEQKREQPGEQDGKDGQNGQNGQKMSAEELKRAAEALRKMAQGGMSRQQMRSAEGRVIDVREMLKRAQSAKPGGAGQDGKGGPGGQQAGEGEGEPGEDAARAFEKAAQGKPEDGQGDMLVFGENDGQGGMKLLGGKPGGPKIPGVGNGQGEPVVGQDGIGQGHDKRLFGDKTDMEVETHDDFIAGQHGDGDSQSKVVMTAAKKGFASRAYRDVHQDYAGVVEDALEKEHIPPGKRTYVRRYFDLIRPR